MLKKYAMEWLLLNTLKYGTLAVVPFQTLLMSLIYNCWKLIVADCDYATDRFYLEEMPTRVTRYIKCQMIADTQA